MADTFTTSLEFRLQTVGGNNNSWGSLLNTTISNIDVALGGVVSKSMASGDVTLTTDENRNPLVVCTGTLTANRNLIVKTQTKRFWVYNNTSGAFSVTVKTSAGTGVVVTQGKWALVYCDGTNVESIQEVGDLAALDTVGASQIDADAVTTLKILNSAVTLAKIANIADSRILGNVSGGSAAPDELTPAEVTAFLNAFTGDSGAGGVQGAVPAPSAGDALKALLGDADFHLAEDIAVTSSITSGNGHIYLPGGYLVQMGDFDPTTNTYSLTFPIPFPNAVFQVIAVAQYDGDTGGAGTGVVLRSDPTTTGANFSTDSGMDAVRWIAIGN